MHICLLSLTYPPQSNEGIPRQRQILAHELVRLGHQVDVVTIGNNAIPDLRWDEGVRVYEQPCIPAHFTYQSPALNDLLARAQALYEGVCRAATIAPIDIIDVPLWAAQGITTLLREQQVVVWLQTTTAQLIQMRGLPADRTEEMILALEQLCLHRAAGILSDSEIALHTVGRDYTLPAKQRIGVATLGLPVNSEQLPVRKQKQQIEALVVGRLEQRKGTHLLLFEILPKVLKRYPQLRVRIVGRDNSQYDGWYQKHKKSYIESFQKLNPKLINRVDFEGYISDEKLKEYYIQADLMLIPSLYESFGLTYIEAMRVGLPIVAFAGGSTAEIFPNGAADGALIVPNGETTSFIEAIATFIDDPSYRVTTGENGYKHFRSQFTAEHMAKATELYYQQVVDQLYQPTKQVQAIYQVMEALDIGDGVSHITQGHAIRMQALGQQPEILARFAHEKVRHLIAPLYRALQTEAGIIFHYWNYSHITWLLSAVRGPKAIYYHNITPPDFFAEGTASYRMSKSGYEQLKDIINQFDLIIGDSRFNITEIVPLLQESRPSLVIYPVIEKGEDTYDEGLFHSLKSSGEVHIVFVGRIAPNKRQDRLIQLFDYYYRHINRQAHLWLVGNDQGYPEYYKQLFQLQQSSIARDRIHLTGKVSVAQMNAYYRAATIFVCASEHEGFCLPIAEAMTYDIPVLAYGSTAIPETMGESGMLVYDWDLQTVAELMHLAIVDPKLRQQIIDGQRKNLMRFTKEEALKRLSVAIDYLKYGRSDPLLEWTELSNSV